MATNILIMGESGTGKSTSISGLEPSETFVINVLDKPLPFKAYRRNYKKLTEEGGNYYATDNAELIIKLINRIVNKMPHVKNVIIDDFQYVMANEFMRRAQEKGFAKFTDIGHNAWNIIQHCSNAPEYLSFYILSHTEQNDAGKAKCKTIGKMLDDKITIEGMFTIVLHSLIVDGRYKFLTQHDGYHIAKSPAGMFEETLIDNDLSTVKAKMNEYFGDAGAEDAPK
jgi:hypothetical protein